MCNHPKVNLYKKALTIFGQNLYVLITVSSSGVARVWRRVRRSVFDAAVLSTRVCASISWMSTLANYFTSGSVHSRPERTENQERTGNFLMLPPGLAAPRSSSVGWWWRRFGPTTSRFCPWRKKKVPIKYVMEAFSHCHFRIFYHKRIRTF